ncbi:hypothetical protein C0030_004275 [Candidatus Liberibacter solanacearum]|uniref:Lipoprotein n=1 Tax=Candidatus Liberibacter solanacearum TaxID=556287 RepID=A0A3R7P841_9HYPH|nr:hypothetical protein [Candidatus Liberibacter solanacearum]RPD37050.1 hypothetical protein C0030_004275 [Candidatus Liberibacter solanacearum]
MDIKKLGLASTVAVLSVTVALSGCDLFKFESQLKTEKITRLRSTWKEKLRKSDEADFQRNEARRKRDELKDQLDKKYGSTLIYVGTNKNIE